MTVRAVTSFAAPGRMIVREGDILKDDDPLAVKFAAYFEPSEVAAERAVETATAAPGEKRQLSCPEDGCDYTGGQAGLKIHTARTH